MFTLSEVKRWSDDELLQRTRGRHGLTLEATEHYRRELAGGKAKSCRRWLESLWETEPQDSHGKLSKI